MHSRKRPIKVGKTAHYQGRTNPAFSQPCLFLSNTRHFRHFRRFRGSEEPNPCFQWVECKFVIFAVFVKTAPFWQGTKTRFTKNTVCATPTLRRGNGPLRLMGCFRSPRHNGWKTAPLKRPIKRCMNLSEILQKSSKISEKKLRIWLRLPLVIFCGKRYALQAHLQTHK